jgi:PiT family inorganic phosphate transporter
MLTVLLFVTVFFVAYANGANANFKGVASLYGSGTAGFTTAVRWAAVTTVAGAVVSVWWVGALLKTFSGKGLVPEALVADPVFLLSAAVGAMLTGGLATWLGFPVSTTHALTGGLLGAGLAAEAAQVNWQKLGSSFALPLLLGPLLAILLGGLLYWGLRRLKLAPDHRTRALDALHFLSAGAVCFARGMNDTPKMAALLGGVAWVGGVGSMTIIAVAMTLGGLLSARRVAETLAHQITDMNPGQGFAANLTTAMLVILGSIKGLPLSTTHVTVGALLGIGVTTGQAKWRTVIPVLLAWVITVPCAAVLAAGWFTLSRPFLSFPNPT